MFRHRCHGYTVHYNACIGKCCKIMPNVRIIGSPFSKGVSDESAPCIGNNAFVVTSASILGDINTGSNVIIGTNAVVLKDVPNNSIALGRTCANKIGNV